jgi:hypothetical protein
VFDHFIDLCSCFSSFVVVYAECVCLCVCDCGEFALSYSCGRMFVYVFMDVYAIFC